MSAYATAPAEARDRAAVLVCDVIDPDGPSARALDLGPSDGDRGISGSDGIRGFDDDGIRGFDDDFPGFDDFDDLDDRSCADVIAGPSDDGFRIEEFLAVGSDNVVIFALDRDD